MDPRSAVRVPYMREKGASLQLVHPTLGQVDGAPELFGAGVPIQFSASPVEVSPRAPLLGEHNDEVLKELLDLNPEDLRRLRDARTI